MTYPKNIQFSILIPVQSRQREFNFRKRNSEYYDGDVSDERNQRYYFNVRKEADRWVVAGDNIPDWLVNVELLISTSVTEKELQLS